MTKRTFAYSERTADSSNFERNYLLGSILLILISFVRIDEMQAVCICLINNREMLDECALRVTKRSSNVHGNVI